MNKRIAILQSNYIPWKGYFDIIKRVDEFVIYDEVQYTRNDWRNRNLIKTPEGLHWLTIPIRRDFGQLINEAVIADENWAEIHWETIRHAYGKASMYKEMSDSIEKLYSSVSSNKLSEINYHFIKGINTLLNIDTRITWSTDYDKVDGRTMRLVSICRQAGAEIYLTGPSARDYLDESLFKQYNIKLEWMDYEGYPRYKQVHGPFEHKVSIIDLLFHTGSEAVNYMKY